MARRHVDRVHYFRDNRCNPVWEYVLYTFSLGKGSQRRRIFAPVRIYHRGRFCNMVLTCAVSNYSSIEAVVIQIHTKIPNADIWSWVNMIQKDEGTAAALPEKNAETANE